MYVIGTWFSFQNVDFFAPDFSILDRYFDVATIKIFYEIFDGINIAGGLLR